MGTREYEREVGDEKFCHSWSEQIWDSTLSSAEKTVALAMLHCWNIGENTEAGIDYLVEMTSLSASSVKVARLRLVRLGFITRIKRGNRRRGESDVYEPTLPHDLMGLASDGN